MLKGKSLKNLLYCEVLKVPKWDIFDLFDCNDLFVMKCLWLGDWNKKIFFFLTWARYHIITLATIFYFELSQAQLFQIRLRATWMCQNGIFWFFNFFHWLKLDLIKFAKLVSD
jgi:hypothetical protein